MNWRRNWPRKNSSSSTSITPASDATTAFLRAASETDARVRGLRLVARGRSASRYRRRADARLGDAVVIMNATNPPEVIVQMYARWLEGYHVASAQCEELAVVPGFKQKGAATLYRLLDRFSAVIPPENESDFRLLDREVVHAFLQLPERDRSLAGGNQWISSGQSAQPANCALVRQWRFSLPMRPSHLCGWLSGWAWARLVFRLRSWW